MVVPFAERVRNSSSDDVFLGREIGMLVAAFRTKLGDASVQPLVEAAIECGFSGEDSV